jgi:DNA polymerase I-like protein with 3'-5' exonuclease and polymerase domains
MIYLVTNRPDEYIDKLPVGAQLGTLEQFYDWYFGHSSFQLDTETTFTKDSPDAIIDRKLLLIQVGDINGNDQWLFEYTVFSDSKWHKELKDFLESKSHSFILHNARFDYVVIKQNLDITVENVHDTFLMSKILNTGLDLEKGYHSLASCLNRFFNIKLDKSEQTTFTHDVLTKDQIIYAANDVIMLYDLFIKLKELLESWDLWYLYNNVEREVLKVYGDMELSHMNFDINHWKTLSNELQEESNKTELELNNLVVSDSKLVTYLKNSSKVLGKALIQPKDTLDISWASNTTRKLILQTIIPELKDINRFTKPELKRIYKSDVLSDISKSLLNKYLNREFKVLNRYLRIYYKPWLINNGLFIPKNTININWNSTQQRLYVFQFYYPNMKDTNAKTLNRIKINPLINKYKKFIKIRKYVTTYGLGFIEKYVSRSNTISLHGVRQILNTGRIAGSILLQLPAQAKFRNAFLPPYEDWVFVDSDYSSQELAIMAYLANEPELVEIIRSGKDAHMFVTQQLFPDEWIKAAEPGCIHLTTGKRCKCESHNKMRNKGKAFNFGIPFGMTYIGLAERLNISRSEAKLMLDKYYDRFPNLSKFFKKSESFGMNNKYIVSAPPTKRIRFFHEPEHSGELQAIGREAKNFPIQETAASMVKVALIKLRKYIMDNDYPAILLMPIHDEILSTCHKDNSEEWKEIQELAMKEAADLYLEDGLLGVDTKITDKWTK